MNGKKGKQIKAIDKELLVLEKQEKKIEQEVLKVKPAVWKQQLESKIPDKVYDGLESAFCKAFSALFHQGRVVIEKTYNKEEIQTDYAIRDYAVQLKGRRKELRKMQKNAQRLDVINLTVTTLEGVALGTLGIGMPDIVLFLGTLLKGIYETALSYGYDYESCQEQFLILKMMEVSLCTGERWKKQNKQVDFMLTENGFVITQEELEIQLKTTASVFAMDMLLLKFIQGLPIIGIVGGAANPLYYKKILKYVHLKYQKRYLLALKKKCSEEI